LRCDPVDGFLFRCLFWTIDGQAPVQVCLSVDEFPSRRPVTNAASAMTVDVDCSYRVFVKMIQSNETSFALSELSATSDRHSRAMSLILAELTVSPEAVFAVLSRLLLSEDPTVFSCALLLARAHSNPNFGHLLFEFTFCPPELDPPARTRLFGRLCLMLAIACANPEFCLAFASAPEFVLFCSICQEMVIDGFSERHWHSTVRIEQIQRFRRSEHPWNQFHSIWRWAEFSLPEAVFESFKLKRYADANGCNGPCLPCLFEPTKASKKSNRRC
jgi:hypothetical protein